MMPGMIMLWYGSVNSIPSGWHLCDGTVGTPDLRNRFVLAAGDTFNPGAIGGSFSHNHTFVGDGHSHDLTSGVEITDVTAIGDFCHHTSTNSASGTTDAKSHFPSYHALCYIMKLPIP